MCHKTELVRLWFNGGKESWGWQRDERRGIERSEEKTKEKRDHERVRDAIRSSDDSLHYEKTVRKPNRLIDQNNKLREKQCNKVL